MKKAFGIFIVVVLVASFFGTGFFLYKKSQKPDVVYETVKPEFENIIKKTVATGSITPRKEIQLKSRVSGVVENVYVEAGQIVKMGEPIARIKIIPDVVRLNDAQMRVKSSKINLANAEQEFRRQQQLFKEKVISEMDFSQSQLEYNLRKQEAEAAENNLELIREGASKNTGTESNLVHATASGMVLDVPVKDGYFVIESNTFNEGTTIASIANMNDMIFEGKVDESEVGKIKEGMGLNLKIGALDTVEIHANLEYISPKGVEKDGAIQFEIRAAIQNDRNVFLRAGYSANADIVLDQKDSVLSIKESNLIFDKDKTFVDVETGEQQFERREVKTGLSDGINIEVVSGLKPEDKIKKL